jgi:hypothetical protein
LCRHRAGGGRSDVGQPGRTNPGEIALSLAMQRREGDAARGERDGKRQGEMRAGAKAEQSGYRLPINMAGSGTMWHVCCAVGCHVEPPA